MIVEHIYTGIIRLMIDFGSFYRPKLVSPNQIGILLIEMILITEGSILSQLLVKRREL